MKIDWRIRLRGRAVEVGWLGISVIGVIVLWRGLFGTMVVSGEGVRYTDRSRKRWAVMRAMGIEGENEEGDVESEEEGVLGGAVERDKNCG